MDPQQALFTYIKTEIEKLGYDVYDGALPPEDTPYPFVYLADSMVTGDFMYKGVILEDITQTVHVWHSSPRKRGDVSNMLAQIKLIASKLDSPYYYFRLTDVSQTILTDTTTRTPLLHGVLELSYKLEGAKSNED